MGKRADKEIAAVLEGGAQVLRFADPFRPMNQAVRMVRKHGYEVIHRAQQGSRRGVLLGGRDDRVLLAQDRATKDFLVMHQRRSETPRRVPIGKLKSLLS